MIAESTYASRMRVRNKLRLLSRTETDVYTANKTTVIQDSLGSVTIRQFISPEWQNMFLRIGDEWWLDFVRTVNAANLMLKEQTPLGTDGSIVELCSGLKSTISQLSDGDVLIQQDTAPILGRMCLGVQKEDWHDFVKAVNTANLILKKKEVRDG